MVQSAQMQVAISEAKGRLTDLVRRAERGEAVELTRHGKPVIRLVPSEPLRSSKWSDLSIAERREKLKAISAEGGRLTRKFSIDWRQAQDELYNEQGLSA